MFKDDVNKEEETTPAAVLMEGSCLGERSEAAKGSVVDSNKRGVWAAEAEGVGARRGRWYVSTYRSL